MSDKKKKVPENFRGVFYTVTEDGKITDEGIVDAMLDNEDEITEQLIRLGIIKDMRIILKDLERGKRERIESKPEEWLGDKRRNKNKTGIEILIRYKVKELKVHPTRAYFD